MPISADQAREIARGFLEMSHDLGSYRFDNWGRLTKSQRQDMENAAWDLLNYSSSLVTDTVGITLADMEGDLRAIASATSEAKSVVATIEEVKDVIKVAGTFVQLGGAIASRQPSAIARAAIDAFKVAKAALSKHRT